MRAPTPIEPSAKMPPSAARPLVISDFNSSNSSLSPSRSALKAFTNLSVSQPIPNNNKAFLIFSKGFPSALLTAENGAFNALANLPPPSRRFSALEDLSLLSFIRASLFFALTSFCFFFCSSINEE